MAQKRSKPQYPEFPLTVARAAKATGWAKRTISNRIRTGELVTKGKGSWKIDVEDLLCIGCGGAEQHLPPEEQATRIFVRSMEIIGCNTRIDELDMKKIRRGAKAIKARQRGAW
jgi:hypothetical protein